jgi:hypothetical protein
MPIVGPGTLVDTTPGGPLPLAAQSLPAVGSSCRGPAAVRGLFGGLGEGFILLDAPPPRGRRSLPLAVQSLLAVGPSGLGPACSPRTLSLMAAASDRVWSDPRDEKRIATALLLIGLRLFSREPSDSSLWTLLGPRRPRRSSPEVFDREASFLVPRPVGLGPYAPFSGAESALACRAGSAMALSL